MPRLKNTKWERFAQEQADGKSAAESYRLAGWKGEGRAYASGLKKKPAIKARIEELLLERAQNREIQKEARQQLISVHEPDALITKTWLQIELTANLELARQHGNIAAANKAVELLGKLTGVLRDEREGNSNAAGPRSKARTEPNKERPTRDPDPSSADNLSRLNRLSQTLAGSVRAEPPAGNGPIIDGHAGDPESDEAD